jgi:hypothetical protein
MSELVLALQEERHAIYRGPRGCCFVVDNSPEGNGYSVTYNSNSDTPIFYRDTLFDRNIQLPFIVSSEGTDHWYPNQKALLFALRNYDTPLGESVPVKEVEG